jgi:hypothetical protein
MAAQAWDRVADLLTQAEVMQRRAEASEGEAERTRAGG